MILIQCISHFNYRLSSSLAILNIFLYITLRCVCQTHVKFQSNIFKSCNELRVMTNNRLLFTLYTGFLQLSFTCSRWFIVNCAQMQQLKVSSLSASSVWLMQQLKRSGNGNMSSDSYLIRCCCCMGVSQTGYWLSMHQSSLTSVCWSRQTIFARFMRSSLAPIIRLTSGGGDKRNCDASGRRPLRPSASVHLASRHSDRASKRANKLQQTKQAIGYNTLSLRVPGCLWVGRWPPNFALPAGPRLLSQIAAKLIAVEPSFNIASDDNSCWSLARVGRRRKLIEQTTSSADDMARVIQSVSKQYVLNRNTA